MHLIFKRILAWIIDWVIILLYAVILGFVVTVLSEFNYVTIENLHPVDGQLIGFYSLTLPVVLYFIVLEAGKRHATVGKRLMKIEVTADHLRTGQVIARNVVKFLPWEFAHAGILWVNYIQTPETPLWIWLLLFVPQVLVAIYLMSIIATKGSRSLYDRLAGTRVRHLTGHLPVIVFCAFIC